MNAAHGCPLEDELDIIEIHEKYVYGESFIALLIPADGWDHYLDQHYITGRQIVFINWFMSGTMGPCLLEILRTSQNLDNPYLTGN